MSDPDNPPQLQVAPAEGGQKLLQFLLRRLNLPQPLLHRWVRTGQIRLNSRRCKPFARVEAGDAVRLPPFALPMAARSAPRPVTSSGELPPLVAQTDGLLVYDKPAGLPTHGGSGHMDSLASRLAAGFADADFRPTPAHRLDKDTSGLLLVATTYTALRAVQEALRQRDLSKEYLCWAEGVWPHREPMLLRHSLGKRYDGPDEKVRVGVGKDAACVVVCLRREATRSLLHLRLLTGRTHQIRAQLAAEGHPLCGDVKYGGRPGQPFHLHAVRLELPGCPVFAVLPPWGAPYAVTELPPPLPDTVSAP